MQYRKSDALVMPRSAPTFTAATAGHRARMCRVLTLVTLVLIGGCASWPLGPAEPPAVANAVRSQMGQLAVRGPSRPTVHLASDLDTKGKAAGKTAAAAGVTWLGGTFQAAGESGDPMAGGLIMAFGLITAPVVAAGGALYGASAADSREAIEAGNRIIARKLDFAPQQLRRALEAEISNDAPLPVTFVDDESNAALRARGFGSVLDVDLASVSSKPDDQGFQVVFEATVRTELQRLDDGKLLDTRSYHAILGERAVSRWAADDGARLESALQDAFADTAHQLAEEHFRARAIRVQGLEPVSRSRFRVGRIAGTRPMFVWTALDGEAGVPTSAVTYEIVLFTGNKPPDQGIRTTRMRYVPDEPLQSCKSYSWRIRAHYRSFADPVTTEWTPTYRFRTPCER